MKIPDCKGIQLFHSEAPKGNKEHSIEGLKNRESEIKLVIATTSLGMEIDCANFYNVIIYCPPTSVADLIQEMGRVGRDGRQSLALILYNSYYFHVDEEVKKVLKTTECRRTALMKPFSNEKEQSELKTGTANCCDLCYDRCTDKDSFFFGVEKFISPPDVDCLNSSDDDLPADSDQELLDIDLGPDDCTSDDLLS